MNDLSNTTLTLGSAIVIASIIVGLFRAVDWFNAKFRASEEANRKLIAEATAPLAIKQAATELRAEQLAEKLKDFQVSVVSNFVSNASVMHLENRMDQGFNAMQGEMSTLREMLLKKLSGPNCQ